MGVLPKRQQEVYDFIKYYHLKNGIGPSLADIAEGLNLANTTIETYVNILRKKKRVTRIHGVPRSLKVVPVSV
jgi:SOS-response transcriptional repressor LexA